MESLSLGDHGLFLAPLRISRVLDNQVGDPRLWDPSDGDFWSVCPPIGSEKGSSDSHKVLTPGEDVRCRLCPLAQLLLV